MIRFSFKASIRFGEHFFFDNYTKFLALFVVDRGGSDSQSKIPARQILLLPDNSAARQKAQPASLSPRQGWKHKDVALAEVVHETQRATAINRRDYFVHVFDWRWAVFYCLYKGNFGFWILPCDMGDSPSKYWIHMGFSLVIRALPLLNTKFIDKCP